MKAFLRLLALFVVTNAIFLKAEAQTDPLVSENVVFAEENGMVSVEAEYFYKQSKTDVRQWYRHSKTELPNAGRDEDGAHCYGASNNSYLEILPDTRITHDDVLTAGENFSNEPGKMALLHYKVHIANPGRYYVWVRAYSTGSEDNGLHVGLNGEWPENGARLQWCEGKQSWRWESKQRTEEVHCGEPYLIYLDIDKPGEHEILFSMREDGFEFDKFLMTTDREYIPEADEGPEVKVYSGKLPEPFPVVTSDMFKSNSYSEAFENHTFDIIRYIKATDFQANEYFYIDQDKWLAINPDIAK